MIFRWQPASTGELAWLGDDHAVADVPVTVDGDRIALVQQVVTAPPADVTPASPG